jgi:hypothetical protein
VYVYIIIELVGIGLWLLCLLCGVYGVVEKNV